MADDTRREGAREALVRQARRASEGRPAQGEGRERQQGRMAQGRQTGHAVQGEGYDRRPARPMQGENCDRHSARPTQGESRDMHPARPMQGEGRDRHPARSTQGEGRDRHPARPMQGEGRDRHPARPMQGEGRDMHPARPMQGEGRDRHPARPTQGNAMSRQTASTVQGNGRDTHPSRPSKVSPNSPRVADGTPSRRAAHRALGLVTREGAYAGLALDRVLGEAHMSAADPALATEVFYGTLEHMAKIDLLLGQLMARAPEKPVLDVLRISLYQLMYLERVPASAVCDEAVGLTRALGFEGATGMVNGVLRNFVRRRGELKLPAREDGLERYLAVEYSMPEFVCAALVKQYGAEQTERILAWRGGRHIVLRPNTLRIDAAEFERRLDAAGLRYERSRVPGAYRVYGMGAVDKNALYRQGLFSVQGESSLLCAQVLAPRPGMQVLDACAAPGGKAAALAELMQGAGRVYACDLHAHRVELIRALAARLGHDMIKVRQQDAARFVPDWEQAMDAVLCDVPCSGLGVVAAKPDIRLNITQAELEELPRIQAAILANSSRYVRPGGTLVYSTCTLLDAENRDVVRAFLEGHPEFKLDDVSAYVPECFRAGVQDGMLTLLGCRDDVDGFFIARMVRR